MPKTGKSLSKKKPVQDDPGSGAKSAKKLSKGRPSPRSQRPQAPGPGQWLWPTLSALITTQPGPGHQAFDVAGNLGDPVIAPTRATVTDVQMQESGYGLNVRLQAETGEEIVLAHLEGIAPGIQPGAQVEAGQAVGLLGSTGRSTGPHLHLEVRQPGPDRFNGSASTTTALDPRAFFARQGPGSAERKAAANVPSLSSFNFVDRPLVPEETLAARARKKGSTAPDERRSFASMGAQAAAEGVQSGLTAAFSPGRFIGQQIQTIKEGVQTLRGEEVEEGNKITIAETPLGPITIPQPGEMLGRSLVFGAGALIAVVSLIILVSRSPKAREVAGAAAGFIPGVGTVKSAAGVAKALTE